MKELPIPIADAKRQIEIAENVSELLKVKQLHNTDKEVELESAIDQLVCGLYNL